MGGPRISSGTDSRQDVATPPELISSLERLLKTKVVFDLAADRMNTRHARYFAPEWFEVKFDPAKLSGDTCTALSEQLEARGALVMEALEAFAAAVRAGVKATIRVRNHDDVAVGLDTFKHDWLAACVYAEGHPGLGWLNPEFSDIGPYAKKCWQEAARGASVALLVPASVGAVWFREHCAGKADVRFLTDRVCFDGKNPFPKDCLIAHYHPAATGLMRFWSWKREQEFGNWEPTATKGTP